MKKILIVGGGGREHALAKKCAQSPGVEKIFLAPGNGGTSGFCTNLPIDPMDFEGLIAFSKEEGIDLTIVGPEDPLVAGIVDAFEEAGLAIIGPRKEAALLEGSKAHAKDFMKRHGIPTAEGVAVRSLSQGLEALEDFRLPVVVKADGLAAGKGVVICHTLEEAEAALRSMLKDKQFGQAGEQVVIEEYLQGAEASLLCFVDGSGVQVMAPAQDYKKVGEGGTGLNTGGMGSFSPSVIMTPERMEEARRKVLDPFFQGMKEEGRPFRGILFVGLMIDDGRMDVLEFNVRFGDPETQVILDRLETDLVDIFEAMLEDRVTSMDLSWSNHHALCVMMVSGGYPEKYEKGKVIDLQVNADDVIHSGTQMKEGRLLTSGGRVLALMGRGKTLEEARTDAYDKVGDVQFEKMYYRGDIGAALRR